MAEPGSAGGAANAANAVAGRTVLVTGANGFIGSHAAAAFAAAGYRVRGLVRRNSDRSFLAGLAVEPCHGDLADRASLAAALPGVDLVVHVAGFASDWGPWQRFHTINVRGTQHLAECALAAGVRRFVHVSSASLHGFAGRRHMTEQSPMPVSRYPYVESKRQAELWLWQYAATSGLPVVAVRPGNVWGPRDHTFLQKYVAAIRKGQGGYIGGGRAWTCPVYVENLTALLLRVAEHPAAVGEAFLATDGLDIDWRTFTEKLCEAGGLPKPRLSLPYWLGMAVATLLEGAFKLVRSKRAPLLTRYRIQNGGRDYHFSMQKARERLGFVPPVSLDEGMRRTAAWLRATAS
ncbi:MAG: NAD-dependent epimerase/dehydratase family protein [Planctomycetes bacterium]|nr:NAD-dependent epimerase/dehydratase family protein [Planctomycetota bacterium]